MKKIIYISLLLFFCINHAYAEQKQISFEGKYKDKDCIFLEYSETIKVNEDWSYRKEEYKKVKILKEEARSMGEIPIPYEKGRDKIVEISAYTIIPDGKRHKYTKIQDVNAYASYPVYSDDMVKIVTMPEVNVGSIIKCKIVTESKGEQIKNAFWKEIYLNTNVPTKLLKTTVILPKKLAVQYKKFNLTHKPKITQNHSTITYTWEVQDVYDDRKAEDYLPSPSIDDIKEAVEFSSIANWSDISNWYYGLVQKNLKITPEIEQAAQKAIEGKRSPKDKIRAILEFIQDNFRYVSMSFGAYSLEPHPTDEVFKNKYGDCKDLSLLCMAMLKVAGIKSSAALFNDEFSISDPKYDLPIPTLFDHVLLLVAPEKQGSFYIDPLLKGYDLGEYPLGYQNAYTFVITEDGGRLSRLPIFSEERSFDKKEIDIIIYPDGSTLSETRSLWDLDLSIKTRDGIKAMDNTQKEDFFQRLDAIHADGGEILEHRIENLDKRYGRLTSFLKVKRPDEYPITDGLIVLDVAGYEREIEFTKQKRENPIFFPDNTCSDTVTTYHIPKGYRILSLPKNIEKDIGFFSMKREYARERDTITIHEISRQKRLEIPQSDYAKVKLFFNKLPRDTYQRIILKR